MRAKLHLMVIDGEVGEASAKLEELLSRVAVSLVLLDGVIHRLLGQAVLQLEGGDRQAVDEQAQVQGKLRVVVAVAELPGHAEAILPVQDSGLLVSRRRRAVHEVDLVRTMLDALAQHVNGAAPGYLTLQAGQESAPRGAVLVQTKRVCGLGLGSSEEYEELGEVQAELPIVALWLSAYPTCSIACWSLAHHAALRRVAGRARQRFADEALQSLLAGVGGHAMSRLS